MCGIAASLRIRDTNAQKKLIDALAHRGPDDHGEFYDPEKEVFLGHRRLAIIDCSPLGHQPMSNAGGTIWVTFNGEIYNYKQLRDELIQKGHSFRSSSDTEVIVNGFAEYGSHIFEKIDGMWAVVLFDKAASRLYASRDAAGIKPLYFYHKNGTLLFASEISALPALLPSQHIRDEAIKQFLLHGYIYGNETIYEDIHEVPPATTLTFSLPLDTVEHHRDYEPKRYHNPKTLREAISQFKTLFRESVEKTLQADVPVSLFLSGGIDSSLVGYEAYRAGVKLQAFTIGFEENTFDESNIAKKIAAHLGFPHTTWVMKGSDVANDIEKIFDAFGEPFADTSSLPTYYLSKQTHEEGYKVALAGDGADELFGGYPTHYLPHILEIYQRTPVFFDTILHQVKGIPSSRFTKLGLKEKLSRFLYGARMPWASAHAAWKHVFTEEELTHLLAPEANTRLQKHHADFRDFFAAIPSSDPIGMTSKVDFMTFLTSDCLVKSDISAMQHGVEVRLPFLNKKLIDFAWFLPGDRKASSFQTKKLLRNVLAESLPKELTRLPKRGFVPPLAQWLLHDLKPAMLRILSKENIARVEFLDYTYVTSLIRDHLQMKADNTKKIWALMSLVRFFTKDHAHV